ncbi:hypothetical protein FE392_08120 [Xenorhabdus sp. 12]|uniref:N-acetyltransferase domain-containing protein n=1 Tax=Xenorhabdus santafensis TaxID=2582833 RepID=A0ABU4S986_9GAMM|nr:hypothetical protein [Xenorhabdus sp. 12]MDX7987296.1 hypothetical protein [Xenorhabdus sp. 12]
MFKSKYSNDQQCLSDLVTVKKVSAAEAANLINVLLFKNMTEDWGDVNSDDPFDSEQKKWVDKYRDSHYLLFTIKNIAESAMHESNLSDDNLFFIAYYSGSPIGALLLSLRNSPDSGIASHVDIPIIKYVATHCGIRDCGVILIEYVVNESLRLGKGGKLKCEILEAVRNLYLNMGFIEILPLVMQLDPNESPVWHFVNGAYKYKGFKTN